MYEKNSNHHLNAIIECYDRENFYVETISFTWLNYSNKMCSEIVYSGSTISEPFGAPDIFKSLI